MKIYVDAVDTILILIQYFKLIYRVDYDTKYSNYMKLRLSHLNYNKVQTTTLN